MPVNYVMAFLGIGIGMATSAYGIYMVLSAKEIIKTLPAIA
jgi:hypothetical protein